MSALLAFVDRGRLECANAARGGQGGMQVVGPMQLTWYGYQDAADGRSGAWRPLPNMIVGFRTVLGNIRGRDSGPGSPLTTHGSDAQAYAASVLSLERKWAKTLGPRSIQ